MKNILINIKSMRKIILLVLVCMSFCCKDEKKAKMKDAVHKENILNRKKEESKIIKTKDPKTLMEYIEQGDKSNNIEIDQSLGDLINVIAVSLFKEPKSGKVYIVLKLKDFLDEELKKQYRLVVRTHPYSKEDLRPDTIKANRSFDSWYCNLYNHSNSIFDFLYAPIGVIDGFSKIQIQLLEKETKRFSRKSITVEDIEY